MTYILQFPKGVGSTLQYKSYVYNKVVKLEIKSLKHGKRKENYIYPSPMWVTQWLSAELPSNYGTNGNMVEHIILVI